MASLMQAYLSQVGITLEIEQYEETLVKTYMVKVIPGCGSIHLMKKPEKLRKKDVWTIKRNAVFPLRTIRDKSFMFWMKVLIFPENKAAADGFWLFAWSRMAAVR